MLHESSFGWYERFDQRQTHEMFGGLNQRAFGVHWCVVEGNRIPHYAH
jgi:hypothetical protein